LINLQTNLLIGKYFWNFCTTVLKRYENVMHCHYHIYCNLRYLIQISLALTLVSPNSSMSSSKYGAARSVNFTSLKFWGLGYNLHCLSCFAGTWTVWIASTLRCNF